MDKLLRRSLIDPARRALGTFPALIIEGARQVGKSTFATMVVEDRPAVVFTLDDPQVATLVADNPLAFVRQFPDRVMVIDEIQRAPELILPLKLAIDEDRRPGRFVLIGSSDLLRLQRTPDSLAGRAAILRLHGFSQGELAGLQEDFVAWLADALRRERSTGQPGKLAPGASLSRAQCVAMLAAGGYPDMALRDASTRGGWVNAYLRQVLQRDTADIRRVTDPSRLERLARLVAANQAGELVKSRLANEAGIPASTITDYLNVITTLFLVDLIPAWSANLTNREIDRPKAIVSDTALALRLARVKPDSLVPLSGQYLGPLLEGFVAGELLKQRGWAAQDYDIYHYRSSGGLEVDLVIELDGGELIGLEVKTTESVAGRHLKNLRALRDRLGDRLLGGVVLSLSPQAGAHGAGIHALPISALWAHPGAR
ncbi:MAG: ATP-binding protein [Bifidobacteriaceae bacterium]|jgi:predicted AAA+ superfamily ATPase|nr:ATP-binding protein [Bifidobacteriaceae bacterium]